VLVSAVKESPNLYGDSYISPRLTMTDACAFVPQERRDAIAQMTPLRRIGVPEDIAGAVLLLASEQARFITGAYLPVNGGIFMP
jgi:3-oxoacyl-[acyl-carrier protein] reductase